MTLVRGSKCSTCTGSDDTMLFTCALEPNKETRCLALNDRFAYQMQRDEQLLAIAQSTTRDFSYNRKIMRVLHKITCAHYRSHDII